MNHPLTQLCERHYGIKIQSLAPVPAGWSASAWRANTDHGDLFFKVYDKNKPTTRKWIARAASYLPVVLYLSQHTPLAPRMVAPILALDGSYCCEDADTYVLAFPYFAGETVSESRLTPDEVRALAEITAELHSHGAEIPVATDALRERFDVSFSAELPEYLGRLNTPSSTTYPFLSERIAELNAHADALRAGNTPLVLAHTDIHGWNLIRSDRLVLIDWEGLSLAPPEADLFAFTNSFFFGYAWDEFRAAYRENGGVEPDPAALHFYRLRRRLDDIAEFASSLLNDTLTPREREKSIYYLNSELDALARM